MIAAIAFICVVCLQAYAGLKLAKLAWWLTCCAARCWRRWRRTSRLHARRDFGGEFGWLFRLTHELCQERARSGWATVLARDRARVAAERRRRMRGGIDVPGLP